MAQSSCTQEIIAGTPLVIDSPLKGNVCQRHYGTGDVSVTVNADIDARGTSQAVGTFDGTVEVSDGVVISVDDAPVYYGSVTGIDMESVNDLAVVLGKGATINVFNSGESTDISSYAFGTFANGVFLDGDGNGTTGISTEFHSGSGSTISAEAEESDQNLRVSSAAVIMQSDGWDTNDPLDIYNISFTSDDSIFTSSASHINSGNAKAVAIDLLVEDVTEGYITTNINGGEIHASGNSAGMANVEGISAHIETNSGRASIIANVGEVNLLVSGNANSSHVTGINLLSSASGGLATASAYIRNSDITVTSSGGEAYATGLALHDPFVSSSSEANITLENSSFLVQASGTSSASAVGIGLTADSVDVELNNTTIKTTSTGPNTLSAGFVSTEGQVTLVLDGASRIEASMAVALQGAGSRLVNSGFIERAVRAPNIEVLSQGVIAGTVNSLSDNLIVATGGELQIKLTNNTDPKEAAFSAKSVTLADGARIHINGASELYSPQAQKVDYRIIEALDSLTTNQQMLELFSSGLISVDWSDCNDLSLCVSVSAQDLALIAQEQGASNNGVRAETPQIVF